MNKQCVVFVCNTKYWSKLLNSIKDLVTIGNYKGDIVVIIGNDKNEKDEEVKLSKYIGKNVIVKKFPDINFGNEFNKYFKTLKRLKRWVHREFQYHKFYVFDKFFKKWDNIFYIDCGMKIVRDINPMLKLFKENTILAHSDGWPTYENKLLCQFDKTQNKYKDLEKEFELNVDYFQTTIMMFDTKIIKDNTVEELINLTKKYPISITNDQGMIALYWIGKYKKWEQLPLGYYSFFKSFSKQVMHKR